MKITEHDARCGQSVDIGRVNHGAFAGTCTYIGITQVIVENENNIGGSHRYLLVADLSQVIPFSCEPAAIVRLSGVGQPIAEKQG